jgi:hypothetical protein
VAEIIRILLPLLKLNFVFFKNILSLFDDIFEFGETGKDCFLEDQELSGWEELLCLLSQHIHDMDGSVEVSLLDALENAMAGENRLDDGLDHHGLTGKDFES